MIHRIYNSHIILQLWEPGPNSRYIIFRDRKRKYLKSKLTIVYKAHNFYAYCSVLNLLQSSCKKYKYTVHVLRVIQILFALSIHYKVPTIGLNFICFKCDIEQRLVLFYKKSFHVQNRPQKINCRII